MVQWAYHSLVDPGNILAAAIFDLVLVVIGRKYIWQKHIKPHLEKTAELHGWELERREQRNASRGADRTD